MSSPPFRQLRFRDLPEQPRIAHPFFETEAHEIEVAGVRTHYRTWGSGPPLLLVHGLMTAGYSWRYVLEPLGARYTLYIPDLPGSGRSGPAVDYTAEGMGRWIGAFIDAVGIPGTPVIGNSMGGYLCMQLALQRPEVMGRLVNLHSPGVPMARLYALRAALSLPGSFRLLRWLVHYDPQFWVHKNVHYYDETLKSLEEAKEYGDPLSSRDGVEAFGWTLYDTMAPRPMKAFLARLSQLQTPLLMVYAETDPVVPPWVAGQLMDALPDHVEIVWLQQASHFAHVDAPERFLPPVLDYLARKDP